jgi:uncharacterized protein (TIGR03067 family)
MHVRAILLLTALPSIAIGQAVPDANKAEVEKLQGKWVRDAIETAGNKSAGRNITLEIKGEQWVVTSSNGETRVTYSVDASKTPKQIDMILKNSQGNEVTWHGIYKIEGDTLTLCRATGDRPTEFKAEEQGTYLTVWKRAKE